MKHGWAFGLAAVLAGASIGCGGGSGAQAVGPRTPTAETKPSTPTPATGPTAGGGPPSAAAARPAGPADPFALPEGPRDDAPVAPPLAPYPLEAWTRTAAVKGLAAAPAACAAFASRAPAKTAPADLVAALAERDPAKRDALLAARDGAEAPGLVRALRAELAPVECADAIVDPYLRAASANAMSARHAHALVGLSLAAKLARTAHAPPTLPPAAGASKEAVRKFVMGPLRTWVTEQAIAIDTLGGGAAGLSGYGRGLAAIEAGHADLRLVDQLRSAPTPASWDAELKAVYEAALDEALEPRKQRGRDAVLVGLSDLADAGVVRDARVARARALLAKLYGGSRIDALDRLALPDPPKAEVETPLARAATAVPVFWVDTLGGAFDAVASGEDPAWAAVLSRGVPRATRAKMRAGVADAAPAAASAYARARLDLGRVSYRRIDFVEAAYAAKRAAAAPGAKDDDKLVLALALSLVAGPNGARALMTAPATATAGLRETAALDAVATEKASGAAAGMAAFDAAFLRSLAAMEAPDPAAAFTDVAARYRKAAPHLPAPLAKEAELRASDAEAAAKVAPPRRN